MSTWAEVGNNLTTVDNVGIGTESPTSLLHANGVVTITAGTGANSRVVLGPGGEASSLIKSEVERGSISPFETKGSKLTFATYPIVNNAPVRIGLNGVPAKSTPTSAAEPN